MRNSTTIADSILVVGAAGQLGRELVRPCEGCGGEPAALVRGTDRPALDITRPADVAAALKRLRPRAVINAAAYTDVDGCQANPARAFAVNSAGPENLARACRQAGSRLVHVSTDYVFDGRLRRPYRVEDPIHPQSVYGRSKAEGEQRVRDVLEDHVIVRTSWLFGAHGKNFVKTILTAAGQREELQVVTDQVGRPTCAADLAVVLLNLAQCDLTGTYHFANAGVCSWHAFAVEIVRLAGLPTVVRPMNTAQLNRPAPRPAWSVLDTQKLTGHTGIMPRPWQEALAECMATLRAPQRPRS